MRRRARSSGSATSEVPNGVSAAPPPVLAAGLPRDDGLLADAHQIPGALVGHVHRAASRRNRTELLDFLQQLDFPRPDPILSIEVDSNAQLWKRLGALAANCEPFAWEVPLWPSRRRHTC